jgi:hypothetical protein
LATLCGALSARVTVIVDTPAIVATSLSRGRRRGGGSSLAMVGMLPVTLLRRYPTTDAIGKRWAAVLDSHDGGAG